MVHEAVTRRDKEVPPIWGLFKQYFSGGLPKWGPFQKKKLFTRNFPPKNFFISLPRLYKNRANIKRETGRRKPPWGLIGIINWSPKMGFVGVSPKLTPNFSIKSEKILVFLLSRAIKRFILFWKKYNYIFIF